MVRLRDPGPDSHPELWIKSITDCLWRLDYAWAFSELIDTSGIEIKGSDKWKTLIENAKVNSGKVGLMTGTKLEELLVPDKQYPGAKKWLKAKN